MSRLPNSGLSIVLLLGASLMFFASGVVYASYSNIGTRPVDLASASVALIFTLFLFLLVPKRLLDKRKTRKKWSSYEIEAREIEKSPARSKA